VDTFIRSYVGAISSIWDELLFLIVIGWLIVKRVLADKKYSFSTIDFPILFFALIYLILAFIKSPELDVAIEGYRAVVQYIFWFFLALQLIDSRKVAYRTVWLFIVGIGLLGLHGTYQYVTGVPMLGNWVGSNETLTSRAFSIIGSPNALASVLTLFIPIGFAVFIAEKDIIKKIVALIFTIFMGLGLLFTFSRGAWIAAFIAIVILLIFVGKRLLLPIVTMLAGVMVFVNTLWTRISILFSDEYRAKSASGGRIYRYLTGLEEWSHYKLIGLGIGRYGGAVATNHKLSPFYMDNYYLKTLTESGLIGLSSFLFLIIWTMRQLYLYMKAMITRKYRIISYGIYSGMIGVLIHNFGENIFESPFMVTYFWICAALVVAISKLDKKVENE
jgi:O-antigen ligase